MKTHSIQFEFLITIISAVLSITILVGGLSIYEVDRFIQSQIGDFIKPDGSNQCIRREEMDLILYDKKDTEHVG